ncbi:MAG: glycosyltransferase [Actinomycetota bacterium]|nr:glycosyltransferase [Actinomycetota bacterium]
MSGDPGPDQHCRSPLTACIVTDGRLLTPAVVTARSFVEQHPTARAVILLTTTAASDDIVDDDRIELWPVDRVAEAAVGWRRLVTALEPEALRLALRPRVIRQVLAQAETVVLLDPGALVVGDLTPLVPAPADEAGCTVIPYRRRPPQPPETALDAATWAQLPLFNAGLALFDRRSTELLDWWAVRTFEDPSPLAGPDGWTDRWFDVGVVTFGARVDRTPEVGVGSWNVDERFAPDAAGQLRPDRPTRLLFLGSFDPERPWRLTPYDETEPRRSLVDLPELARHCDDYAGRLAATQVEGPAPLTPWQGMRALASVLRTVFHQDSVRPPGQPPATPFDPDGGDGFRDWLVSTADTPGELPLVAFAAWCADPELPERFPDPQDPDQRRAFLHWLGSEGRERFPDVAVDWPAVATTALERPSRRVAVQTDGVDLVGYLDGEFGLGEAGRRLSAALHAAEVPVATIVHRAAEHQVRSSYRADDVFRHDVAIISTNGPQTPTVHAMARDELRGRHLIGYWHWEVLHALTQDHLPALDLVDEVWCPSKFIAGIFEPRAPGRVRAMPYPLALPADPPTRSRSDVGFGDEPTFLFVFDYLSSAARKNPIGLIEAFTAAFADGEGPRLWLKSINGRHPAVRDDVERVRWAARGRSDITIVDGVVDADHVRSMIAHCDCYVSLHRAEGVGSTISDAMNLARPVIATAWSGNVEFMSPDTAYLVSTRGFSRVGEQAYQAYPPEGFWAEPDLDHAAMLMRKVYEDPAAARAKGEAAARDLRLRFSPEATGTRMRQRLEEIRDARSPARDRGSRSSRRPTVAAQPPIAVLSFNRPHYFEQVLTSLRHQSEPVDGRRVHLFQDGAVNCYSGQVKASEADIAACVALFEAAFPEGTVHESRWNIGVAENFIRAETFVFEELEVPVAYFFEDDLVLAPHYLQALRTIWEVVRDQPRIGYFNAMGPDPGSPTEQSASSRTLGPMHHNWGFGLRRDHWIRISPLMSQYYRLVLGKDYQERPHPAIRELFRSWGVPVEPSSQDSAKSAASLAMGALKVTSGPCLGRYIGELGVHMRPENFARDGWGKTQLWTDPLPAPDPIDDARIDELVRQAIAELTPTAAALADTGA